MSIEIDDLEGEGKQIMLELMEIIPTWQKVDLTKASYNQQYTKTLFDVAIYVLEREKRVIKDLYGSDPRINAR